LLLFSGYCYGQTTTVQQQQAEQTGGFSVFMCNDTLLPGWGSSFDSVSFASTQTWQVGSQIWSDAVQATNCDKTTFNGGSSGNFRSDCRSNPDYPGDLFSWCAVVRFGDVLCPAPWRVPTRQDFMNLDRALGGTGLNNQNDSTLRNKYLNDWGGVYSGISSSNGVRNGQGIFTLYWSQMEFDALDAYSLRFNRSGNVVPQRWSIKSGGHSLRCVR